MSAAKRRRDFPKSQASRYFESRSRLVQSTNDGIHYDKSAIRQDAKWTSLMRAPPIAIVLSSVGGAVCAQPADEGFKVLETCFQLARAADAICSDPKNGAAERLDCHQKASTAQLECLKHISRGTSAGSAPARKSASTVSPEMPTITGSPEVPAGSVSSETPAATVSAGEPASSLKTPPENVPPETPTALSSAVRAEPVHDMTERLEICFQEARAADVACIDPANDTVKRLGCFQSVRAAQVECLENLSHEPPTGTAQNQPADTAWVVSETTSPLDYSPLITAVIRSTSSVKDAPNTLAVRCRGLRTELLLRMEGTWPARASEIQVDYQINDHPSLGYSGLCPRTERPLVTRTMQLDFCGRYQKTHG
jgi:hypothetical protein